MTRNDENTRSVVRQGYDGIVSFLNHFHNPHATYTSAAWGNPAYLEQVKVHLVALASCIEDELQLMYAAEAVEDHG
jgi:phage-related protein